VFSLAASQQLPGSGKYCQLAGVYNAKYQNTEEVIHKGRPHIKTDSGPTVNGKTGFMVHARVRNQAVFQ